MTERFPALFGKSRPLSEALDPAKNSFGFLRLFFAFLVLVDHAFILGGFDVTRNPFPAWVKGQESLGGLAVAGFFVISGYLVTRSYTQSRTAVRYLWKRVLRIFPAFLVCLMMTAAVFGVIAYHRQYGRFSGYLSLSPDSPWSYIYRNAFLQMRQWNIGNLLQATPYQHNPYGYAQAFDGSLWTLIYEFKCYLGVAILGFAGILWRSRLVVLVMSIGLWAMQIKGHQAPTMFHAVPIFSDPEMVALGFIFSLGMVLFLYRDVIPISGTGALVAALVLIASFRVSSYLIVGQVAFAYLCIWLAIALPLSKVDRFGDFSYGLYIYGFIIEQMLALYGFRRLGFIGYVLCATACTLVLAVASWYAIEKPFMKFKKLRLGEAPSSGSREELRGWRRLWNPTRLAEPSPSAG